MVQYTYVLHGTVVFTKLDSIGKYYCGMITKLVYCSALAFTKVKSNKHPYMPTCLGDLICMVRYSVKTALI